MSIFLGLPNKISDPVNVVVLDGTRLGQTLKIPLGEMSKTVDLRGSQKAKIFGVEVDGSFPLDAISIFGSSNETKSHFSDDVTLLELLELKPYVLSGITALCLTDLNVGRDNHITLVMSDDFSSIRKLHEFLGSTWLMGSDFSKLDKSDVFDHNKVSFRYSSYYLVMSILYNDVGGDFILNEAVLGDFSEGTDNLKVPIVVLTNSHSAGDVNVTRYDLNVSELGTANPKVSLELDGEPQTVALNDEVFSGIETGATIVSDVELQVDGADFLLFKIASHDAQTNGFIRDVSGRDVVSVSNHSSDDDEEEDNDDLEGDI